MADGISYAFQGKIFAAGRLWLDPPLVPDAFKAQNILLDATRWCGIYPPGFPLLLAASWLVGAPSLVNPVLLGLAVAGVFRLGKILFDETTWLAACLLTLILGFSFYRFYEINHSGPRYAFEALGVLALLVARALRAAGRLAASLLERVRLGRFRTAGAAAAVVFLALFPLATLLPEQAEALSHAYHAHTPEPLRRLAAAGVGPSALVLVAGNTVEWTYGSFLLENGPDPRRAPRVFARDLPEKRAELLAAYPRKEVWRVDVTLRPLPHPNLWIDNTWDVEKIVWSRLR